MDDREECCKDLQVDVVQHCQQKSPIWYTYHVGTNLYCRIHYYYLEALLNIPNMQAMQDTHHISHSITHTHKYLASSKLIHHSKVFSVFRRGTGLAFGPTGWQGTWCWWGSSVVIFAPGNAPVSNMTSIPQKWSGTDRRSALSGPFTSCAFLSNGRWDV